jgi:ribonuclease D
VAAERLVRTRAAVAAISEETGVPVENLLAPELLRRVTWTPPAADEQSVAAALRAGGARPWQVQLTSGPIAAALPEPDDD